MTMPAAIRDVDELSFGPMVIERSRQLPVVVDFWAPWCGPCRLLGPTLERLVATYNGQIALAKLNTDDNPRLSQEFRIQGIPAVKAFRDGRVTDEFTGALPEPQVRAFLERLLPSEADRLAAGAATLAYSGDRAAAEAEYRRALEADNGHAAANLGLARLLEARGANEEALRLLTMLPADPEATRLRAELNLRRAAGGADLAELEARVAASPEEIDVRYRLSTAFAAAGRYEAALDHLLEVVRRDRAYGDDAGRKSMLEIFAVLGDADPFTHRYRRRLSSLLF